MKYRINIKFSKTFYFIFTTTSLLYSCTKQSENDFSSTAAAYEQDLSDTTHDYTSSVKLMNNRYIVDTNIISKNGNKKILIEKLESVNLQEKKSRNEIPQFITSFLDSISKKRKFDLANPDEEWQIGITNLGKQVFTKSWDPTKNDSVMVLSYDGSKLPTKQLAYFGLGNNIALLSYYCGGITMTQHAIILQFEGNEIKDFWFGQLNGFATGKKSLIFNLRSLGTRSGIGKGKC